MIYLLQISKILQMWIIIFVAYKSFKDTQFNFSIYLFFLFNSISTQNKLQFEGHFKLI